MDSSQLKTLKAIQQHLALTCKERGWDKKSVEKVFMYLTEELGELAKEVRNQATPNKADKAKLELELADVFNYVLEIANRYDIDLAAAYAKKSAINEKRDWVETD